MGIKKRDHVFSNRLLRMIRLMIPRAPVTKRVETVRNGESLVVGVQHQALVLESTAHRDDLVKGGRIIILTVDKEKRLEPPA